VTNFITSQVATLLSEVKDDAAAAEEEEEEEEEEKEEEAGVIAEMIVSSSSCNFASKASIKPIMSSGKLGSLFCIREQLCGQRARIARL